MCICEKDNKQGSYYFIGKRDSITYENLYYQYSENGGPNSSKIVTEKNVNLYLRVNYPYLWETNNGYYQKRLFHCPLCGRFFPPQSIMEKIEYMQEERKEK